MSDSGPGPRYCAFVKSVRVYVRRGASNPCRPLVSLFEHAPYQLPALPIRHGALVATIPDFWTGSSWARPSLKTGSK